MSADETSRDDAASDPRAQVRDALERLAVVSAGAGMSSVASELRDERIPALDGSTLTLVVLGEFNHGKSSFINALVGRDVVPTGITPTTSVITHIHGGAGASRVVREDGTTDVNPEALRSLLTEDAPETVRHVEVHTGAEPLVDGLVIVDTPGVNDISQQKAEITYGYVPRADVVVYVMDASQALKKSELLFIRDRLIRNKLDRVFFVLGKSDSLSGEELEEVRAHVERKLTDVVGAVTVHPLSARRAMQPGGDAAFAAFRALLRDELQAQRDRIVLEGALRAGLRLGSVVGHALGIEERALELGDEELRRRVESVRSRLNESRSLIESNLQRIDRRALEIGATARDNLQDFVAAFTEALPGQIASARVEDVKRYLPDFIQDRLKGWLEDEGAQVALQLELLAEEIIAVTNQNMRGTMGALERQLGARQLDFSVDTFGYDVGVVAVGTVGATVMAMSNVLVGGALLLAAPVLAVVLKGHVDGRVRDQAAEQGVEAIQLAGQVIGQHIEGMVREFAERLKAFVEDSGHRLYRQVTEALERVLEQRRDHSLTVESARSALAVQREALDEVVAELIRLRAVLIPVPVTSDAVH